MAPSTTPWTPLLPSASPAVVTVAPVSPRAFETTLNGPRTSSCEEPTVLTVATTRPRLTSGVSLSRTFSSTRGVPATWTWTPVGSGSDAPTPGVAGGPDDGSVVGDPEGDGVLVTDGGVRGWNEAAEMRGAGTDGIFADST